MDPRTNPPQPRSSSTPVPPQRNTSHSGVVVPPRDEQREAAINIVRGQIDSIYNGDSGVPTPHTTPVATQSNTSAHVAAGQQLAPADPPSPYERSHTRPHASTTPSAQWKQYHSAWQQYYQKYYEQYYVGEVKRAAEHYQSAQPNKPADARPAAEAEKGLTQDQALYDLRQSIIQKAQTSAKKARRSRHFWPIASAVSVMLVIALMQYNQVLIANVKAYMSPGSIQPENIIVDPNSDVPVGPENKMIIPKINVDAPIVMDVGPSNEEQLKAMANGIAHVRYPGAMSVPGQAGNAVFSAHSSSDWTDAGAYKFIFVQLERMAVGDVVYINYQSKRYSYKVYDIKTVLPDDVAALNYTGSDPIITLITCTPLGTAQKRLLVYAKQVSPDPSATKPKDAPAPVANSSADAKKSSMTGTAPTFLEWVFGAR